MYFLDVENLQGNNVQYFATRQTAGKIACKNGELSDASVAYIRNACCSCKIVNNN